MIKLIRDYDEFKNEIDQVYALLELDHSIDEFILNTDFLNMVTSQWTVRPRSISGLLYYLSHNVAAPSSHHHELVTVTKTKLGGYIRLERDPRRTPVQDTYQRGTTGKRLHFHPLPGSLVLY